jgi:hypothetical protein
MFIINFGISSVIPSSFHNIGSTTFFTWLQAFCRFNSFTCTKPLCINSFTSFCLNVEFCLETKPFISPYISLIGLNSQW